MDDKKIGELYRQAGALIFRRCLKLLGDPAAAEDATQEVFLKFMAHAAELDPGDGYLPWIYRVATNHCLNRIRDEARLEVRDPAMLPDLPEEAAAEVFPDRALGAQVLRRFDTDTQSIAVLVLCDGLTQDEAAGVLGLSRKTVGKKLRRFLVQARKFVARVGVES